MVVVCRLLWYKRNDIDISQYSPASQSILDRHCEGVAKVQLARDIRRRDAEGEIFIHSLRHLLLEKEKRLNIKQTKQKKLTISRFSPKT